MRSTIIGGGISGCAVAAALRGTPLDQEVLVLEQEVATPRYDAGVLLNPTGLGALEAIAPEYRWRSEGHSIHGVSLRSASGVQYSQTRIDQCIAVQSSRFIHMLRDAAPGAAVLEGWCLAGLTRSQDGSITHAQLADGSSLEADAFFACDGAHSRARHVLFPEMHLSDVMIEEVMGVATSPSLARRLGHLFHKFHDEEGGLAVELLPLGDTQVACFLQFDPSRWAPRTTCPTGMRAFALERALGWAHEVREALELIDYTRCRVWQARALPPLDELNVANAALVGDAGHAALPFMSQVPNDALADAALLSNLLHRVSDRGGVIAALQRYSELRWPQHRRTFQEGRQLCREFLDPVPCSGPKLPLVA
jgi:2-polyprenyl-6-methoxyphenol hydroxylase-like FAD-dependent oxidoreductase